MPSVRNRAWVLAGSIAPSCLLPANDSVLFIHKSYGLTERIRPMHRIELGLKPACINDGGASGERDGYFRGLA